MVSDCAAPAVWVADPVTTSRVAAAGPTVSEALPEIEPSVTETVGVSTL